MPIEQDSVWRLFMVDEEDPPIMQVDNIVLEYDYGEPWIRIIYPDGNEYSIDLQDFEKYLMKMGLSDMEASDLCNYALNAVVTRYSFATKRPACIAFEGREVAGMEVISSNLIQLTTVEKGKQ